MVWLKYLLPKNLGWSTHDQVCKFSFVNLNIKQITHTQAWNKLVVDSRGAKKCTTSSSCNYPFVSGMHECTRSRIRWTLSFWLATWQLLLVMQPSHDKRKWRPGGFQNHYKTSVTSKKSVDLPPCQAVLLDLGSKYTLNKFLKRHELEAWWFHSILCFKVCFWTLLNSHW